MQLLELWPMARLVLKQSIKAHGPLVYVFGVTRSGIELQPPAPQADTLTTMLRGGSKNGRIYSDCIVAATLVSKPHAASVA